MCVCVGLGVQNVYSTDCISIDGCNICTIRKLFFFLGRACLNWCSIFCLFPRATLLMAKMGETKSDSNEFESSRAYADFAYFVEDKLYNLKFWSTEKTLCGEIRKNSCGYWPSLALMFIWQGQNSSESMFL